MRRTTQILASTVMVSALMTGQAFATEPVSTTGGVTDGIDTGVVDTRAVDAGVLDTANAAVKQVAGGGGTEVRDIVAPNVTSAVVGYIQIVRDGTVTAPTTSYALFGALADPGQWSCAGGGGLSSYTVSCTPVALPVNVSYTCQVLHADINAVSAGSSGRTLMDCNSDGVPEAQTGQKIGPGGYDTAWAASNVAVTAFTCTLDLAASLVRSGCGDPGLVEVG